MRVATHLRHLVPALLFGALAPPALIQAQVPPPQSQELQMRTGVGWAGTIPDAFLGAGAFHFFDGSSWGLYADAKLTHDPRSRDGSFRSDLTVESVERDFEEIERGEIREWDEWVILNAGLGRALTSQFAIVLVAGIARERVIQEYVDGGAERRIAPEGFYFVENEELSGWKANPGAIALIRAGESIAFSTGFEWAPRSFSFGVFMVVR